VLVAAVVTDITFTVTNYVFGTYIQTFTATTLIGAAGALLIILLWIFVLNQIVLFGAEVSNVYGTRIGNKEKLHLPAPLNKIVQPLERAGEKIEEATKDEFQAEERNKKDPEKIKKPWQEKPNEKESGT
jgi:uncharacterized BrkB/YihY/UPF0761 family membrane protein